eukprot:TRINITY_DN4318_c0_g1_i1.p1 TRINITY_DN4318_c0_g1~~TRINITY_DN4318_c0_g1_i1.p1  ORF type:complete len:644 (+),score=39.23 TRINITY_DN4318_c0_g1_i1:31-1932(+)
MALPRGFWSGIPLEYFAAGSNFSNAKMSPDKEKLSFLLDGVLFIANISRIGENGISVDTGSMTAVTTRDVSISTGTEYGGGTYCWSSNSKFIFFASKGRLHRVRAEGGLPEKFPSVADALCYAPTHSSDDTLMFCVEGHNGMSIGIIRNALQKNIDAAWPERLDVANETFLYDPAFHPTSPEKIAFHAWSVPDMLWTRSSIYLYDRKVKQLTTVMSEPHVSTNLPKWSPDGKHLAFVCDKTKWSNIYLSDSDGKNVRLIFEDKADIGLASLWVTGANPFTWISNEKIVFARSVLGNIRLAVVDINTKEVTHLTQLPEGMYGDLASAFDGVHVICSFSSYNVRGDIVVINTASGKMTKLFSSGLKLSTQISNSFVKPEAIQFPTKNGQVCHGLLFLSADANGNRKNAPVLIWAHGGPTGMSINRWQAHVQYWASKGWAVFCVNYRGSIGYGREYRDLMNGKWGVVDVEDCAESVHYLASQGLIDAKKAVIIGPSAGGYTTLSVLEQHPGVFAAGIPICAVSDQFLLNDETHLLERRYNDILIGPLPEFAGVFHERSPANFAHKIVDPILILHGEADTVVPINQAEIIRKNAKGPVEHEYFPGEQHMFFLSPPLLKVIYPRIDKFLTKYVLYKKN